MEQQVNKQIILKYLKGECSPSELQTMNLFMQREDAEQLIDEVWAEEWAEFQEQQISDQEIANWKNRFTEERLQDNSVSTKRTGIKFFALRYAAVWLTMLLSLGVWFGVSTLKKQESNKVAVTMFERVNANGQRVQIRLSDSSIVYLAGGSKLRYPSRFTGNTREISLEGEAFFEIAKNRKKPFIIHTGDVRTLVVGTSFRINAFKDKPFLVEVATGKVRISHQQGNHENQLATLTPGQSMLWKNNHAVLGEINADDVSEWKNGRLVFNGATLKEIVSVFERLYNVDVSFKQQVKAEQHITIMLTANVPLSDIMEVLATTGKFQYKIKGRQVIIN
ncbi:FecR family protein [Pedobacter sp. B4-66]|uniref:FecR family protein n=1 Tax=Pedobacter sp. B4-66 TaxID=2817280 RepID=UPI001BDAF752|nr:FecR family protein [Pedobacter sp. B4-66]